MDGILDFHESRFASGVWLERAKVTGEVTLRGAVVGSDRDGVAVAADGLTVDGNLECNEGFTADGVVRIRGARITGSMNLDDAPELLGRAGPGRQERDRRRLVHRPAHGRER